MKKITLVLALLNLPCTLTEAQTTFLDIGAGFSSMNSTDIQSFTYTNDQFLWLGNFVEITGKQPDMGFTIVSRLEFQMSTLPLSLTAGISYTQLSGKADLVKAQSPVWSSTMYTTGKLETQKNILSIRPGFQWIVIPSSIRVFLGLEVLYNIFGDTRLKIVNPSGTTEGIIEGDTRMGLSFGGGVRTSVFSPIDISIESSYSLNNVISPDVQEEARNTFAITMILHFKFS
jgi:hypothetical protein